MPTPPEKGLIERQPPQPLIPATADSQKPASSYGTMQEIPVERLRVDPDNRDHPQEYLESVARSLTTVGQLQSLVVTPSPEAGCFDVICGNDRTKAARIAGIATLTALVIPRPDKANWLKIAVSENRIRLTLGPIEEAVYYDKLLILNNCTEAALADELGLQASGISRSLALLKRLPAFFQERVQAGDVAEYSAYLISTVKDELARLQLAQRFLDRPMPKPQLEREVAALNTKSTAGSSAKPSAPVRRVALHVDGIDITIAASEGRTLSLGQLTDALDTVRKVANKSFDLAALTDQFRKKPKSRKQPTNAQNHTGTTPAAQGPNP